MDKGWIATSFVEHLRGVASSLDVPIDARLDAALTPQATVADPEGRVAIGAHDALWRRIVAQAGVSAFAETAAAACRLASVGIVGHLVGTCGDLSEAAAVLARYGTLIGPAYVAPQVRVIDGRVAFTFAVPPSLGQYRERGDASTLSVLRVMRALAKEADTLNPVELRLQHARPKDRSWYEGTFDCPVSFECPTTAVVTSIRPEAMGEVKLDRPYADLRSYLERQAESFLRRSNVDDRSYSDSVRGTIEGSLHMGACSLLDTAAAMRVSERTLQRRLSNEGTSFEVILDSTRRIAAEAYLEHTNLSVRDIAKLVGYNDASQFNRAFRRWKNGMRPTELRRQIRRKNPDVGA